MLVERAHRSVSARDQTSATNCSRAGGARDSACVIDEWSKLDEFIDKLPDPETDPRFDALAEEGARARARGFYVLLSWWGFFFERP